MQVLSRPNGIFKSVSEQRQGDRLSVDIEFTSGLKLHQETGQDLVVTSPQGQETIWKGASLEREEGGANYMLPCDGDPKSDIGIDGPVQNDGHGHYSQTLQLQAADGEAGMMFLQGTTPNVSLDTGVHVAPDGTAELWAFHSGTGHVSADGRSVLAQDSHGQNLELPFLLAPTQLGHRYP